MGSRRWAVGRKQKAESRKQKAESRKQKTFRAEPKEQRKWRPGIQNPKTKIQSPEAVSFWLKVKPRSAHERLTYDSSGDLRLELHAPPSEGEANQACVLFFAKALRLPQACVTIVSGKKSRRKLIRITGRSGEETVASLKALAAGGQNG